MATANPAASSVASASAQNRRRWPWLLAVVALGLLAWFWQPLNGYAQTGASYGARVACSCRYLGGRSLEDCRKDFEPGMELVMLSDDATAKSVTARFPILSTQTATFKEGAGCQLEAWRD